MTPGQEQSGIGGTIWDLAGYATWRNPIWTRRIGTVGFDSRGTGWWAKTKGLVNRVVAPGAPGVQSGNSFWARAARTEEILNTPTSAWDKPWSLRGRGTRWAEGLGASVDDFKSGGSWLARATGTAEPRIANLGRAAMHRRMGGGAGAISKLFGPASSLATRHAAGMWVAGRVLTAANTAGLVAGLGQLAFAGFNAIADVGLQARQNFRSTQWGSGVATMRQQAINDMQTRSWAPRSLVGNEAPFLHA